MNQVQMANYLAEQQLKAIVSRGENTLEILQSLFRKQIELRPENWLTQAKQEFELFARHTHDSKPKRNGFYLKLLHGRSPVDFKLDDWGEDGPWIGSLEWFHCTYMTTIGIGFSGGEEYFGGGDTVSDLPSPMYICQDMIYFNGIYYGDWELQRISNE
jgi:hypothetical protein